MHIPCSQQELFNLHPQIQRFHLSNYEHKNINGDVLAGVISVYILQLHELEMQSCGMTSDGVTIIADAIKQRQFAVSVIQYYNIIMCI